MGRYLLYGAWGCAPGHLVCVTFDTSCMLSGSGRSLGFAPLRMWHGAEERSWDRGAIMKALSMSLSPYSALDLYGIITPVMQAR